MKRVFLSCILLLFWMTTVAHATSMAELFDGGSIVYKYNKFFDWQFISLETDGPVPDPALIEVESFGLKSPGLIYYGNDQLMLTDTNRLNLVFSYSVASLDGRDVIHDNWLALDWFDVSEGGYISIYEEIFGADGSFIGDKFVEIDNINQHYVDWDEIKFAPTNFLTVVNHIEIFGTLPGDVNRLEIFHQQYSQTPEPATMLLLSTGLVGIAGAARRKKKNQA